MIKTRDEGTLLRESQSEQLSTLPKKQSRITAGRVTVLGFGLTTLVSAIMELVLAVQGHGSVISLALVGLALLATALVLMKSRWLYALAVPIGAFLLYGLVTQPDVLHNLGNPKTIDGGYAHFLGVALPIVATLMATTASLGAALQRARYRHRMPRTLNLVLCLILGVTIGATVFGAIVQPPHLPTAYLTNGVPTIDLDVSSFTVKEIHLSKGSKLMLKDTTPVQHLLVNGQWLQGAPLQTREPGAPAVNHIPLSGNSVTIGPFATAGTYHIICQLHRGMMLTIIVS